MQFTLGRIRIVLALSISSGIVSIMGSTTIIVVLLRSPKRLKSIYRRIVFGMSCMDILHSLSYVFAGWPLPNDTNSSFVQYAIGNITTCNIQGFFNYLGCMGSVLYDCMLSIYFVMVVVFSTREEYIQKKIEPFFHSIALVLPLTAGIYLWATTHFNESGNICWIASKPFLCDPSDCDRGPHANAYRWYFQGYPIILSFLIVIGCMISLLYSIRKQLKTMDKYGASEFEAKVATKRARKGHSMTKLGSRRTRKTELRKSKVERKQTVTQAILYIAALIMAFLFAFVWQATREHFFIYLLELTFVPLLGFFNFFIFIRPRVVITRQRNPKLSYFKAFIIAITAREVSSPERRGSVGRTIRRSSLTYFGRRSSQTYLGQNSFVSNDIIAAARIVQASELDEEENEEGETQEKATTVSRHDLSIVARGTQVQELDKEDECDEDFDNYIMPNKLKQICEDEEKSGNFLPYSAPEFEYNRNKSSEDEEDDDNLEADFKLTEDYHNML